LGRHDICGAGFAPFGETRPGCDEHKWAAAHAVHDACFRISVCVLATFLVELLVLLYIERCEFLKKPLYLLDLSIVVGTLSLECAQRSQGAHLFDPAKMLILVRCWRFVRIGHGLFAATHEHDAKEQERLREHCHELAGRLHRLHTKLEQAQAPAGSNDLSGKPTTLSLDPLQGIAVKASRCETATESRRRRVAGWVRAQLPGRRTRQKARRRGPLPLLVALGVCAALGTTLLRGTSREHRAETLRARDAVPLPGIPPR